MAATKAPSQIPDFRRRLARQMADYRKRTAERIIEARERQGLDREPLALRAGISVKQLRRIERGQSNARLSTIRKIADALELQVTDLRPDLEAEEEVLHAQLERIEEKVDSVLNYLQIAATERREATPEAAPKSATKRTRRAAS
jgi:transcriptional regulator with XRE-family HTH domain